MACPPCALVHLRSPASATNFINELRVVRRPSGRTAGKRPCECGENSTAGRVLKMFRSLMSAMGRKRTLALMSGMGGKPTLVALGGAPLRRQSVIPRIEVSANWLRKANHLF